MKKNQKNMATFQTLISVNSFQDRFWLQIEEKSHYWGAAESNVHWKKNNRTWKKMWKPQIF